MIKNRVKVLAITLWREVEGKNLEKKAYDTPIFFKALVTVTETDLQRTLQSLFSGAERGKAIDIFFKKTCVHQDFNCDILRIV